MSQNNVIRTKMSAALIDAIHVCNKTGGNAGRVGRLILTHEAKGTGVKYAPRSKPRQLQAGFTLLELFAVLFFTACWFSVGYVMVHFINKFW